MQICSRCVLDDRFPGITFDSQGVCSYCTADKGAVERAEERAHYDQKLIELFASHRSPGGYDCLVAYSGGKDSTYTLHLLKQKYGVRLLAFTYDNWFQSAEAGKNIRRVLRSLKVDHFTVTPSFELVERMTLASMDDGAYSPRALIRASSICTSCISLIRLIALRTVIEREIPFLAFGMSPGQAPVSTALVRMNAEMVRLVQNGFVRPLRERVGELLRPFLLQERHFAAGSFPYSINPLALNEYDEDEIVRVCAGYGWKKPVDTDANSTNCLLNSFANDVHARRFGFNPYAHEIAGLVREGHISREEGLKKLQDHTPASVLRWVSRELGIPLG